MGSRGGLARCLDSREQNISSVNPAVSRAVTSFSNSLTLRRTTLASVLLLLVLALLTFAVNAAEVKSYDVEVPTSPGTIYWVDERRVVFVGLVPTNDDRFARHPGRRGGKLAQLELASGAIKWGDLFIGQLCVDGEKIAYLTYDGPYPPPQNQRYWLWEGTIGNVSKREVTREYLADTPFDFTYSCAPGAALPRGGREFPAAKRLRLEHGVAEYALAQGRLAEFPTRLFRAGRHAEPVTLDAFRGEDVRREWPFLRFKSAYWLTTNPRGAPLAPPGRFKSWWLHPEGRAESVHDFNLKSTFDGWRAWTPDIPYRDGFLSTEGRTRTTPVLGNLGKAGLYHFDPYGKHQKLLAGEIGPWAVSPSGCKLAFGVDDRRNNDPYRRMTLRVLDLCRAY